jgi:hypothetical protein
MVLIYALTGCREVYYPDDLESGSKIPVIQGAICENEVPLVNLSWAMAYASDSMYVIKGATVTITDDLGIEIPFEEGQGGNYTPAMDDFRGVQGRTYTLHVFTTDGNEYVSTPERILKNPGLDSLYAAPVTQKTYSYNEYGTPLEKSQEGLLIMTDLTEKKDTVSYYRFSTKVVRETSYTENPSTPAQTTVYMWESSMLDEVYATDYTVFKDDRQVLWEHQAGFLPYIIYYLPPRTWTRTATVINGWILTQQVYSISREAYLYYNSINNQLNASDQILAPIPSQVKSNIRCVNNPDNPVIGLFEASSKATVYKAFQWKNLNIYLSRELDSFPDTITRGSQKGMPPAFWINL